jgi:hypothetical protein
MNTTLKNLAIVLVNITPTPLPLVFKYPTIYNTYKFEANWEYDILYYSKIGDLVNEHSTMKSVSACSLITNLGWYLIPNSPNSISHFTNHLYKSG